MRKRICRITSDQECNSKTGGVWHQFISEETFHRGILTIYLYSTVVRVRRYTRLSSAASSVCRCELRATGWRRGGVMFSPVFVCLFVCSRKAQKAWLDFPKIWETGRTGNNRLNFGNIRRIRNIYSGCQSVVATAHSCGCTGTTVSIHLRTHTHTHTPAARR